MSIKSIKNEVQFSSGQFSSADWYQDKASKTAIYPNQGQNPFYPALGLAGEAGEVANKIKKMMRDDLKKEELRDIISKEIGDCMWYIAALCTEFDLQLSDVLAENLNKLYDRKDRGVLQGSGDNR